jgi:hypothetical protein
MATRVMPGMEFFEQLYTRNIPVKFHYDLPYGFRRDVV